MRQVQRLDLRADRLGQHGGGVERGLGEQQHEFLAAVARRQIGGAQRARLQRRGHLLQADVAGGVAKRVVVQLEVVDVEHDQRQRLAAADRAQPLLLEETVEAAAVGDLGQLVDHRRVLQRRLGALVVGDVVQQADEQRLVGDHRRERQVHRAQGAVAVADQHLARAARARRGRIGGERGEVVEVFLGQRGAEQFGQRMAGQFVGAVAEMALARRVAVLDAPARLDHHQSFVHGVDDLAQAVGLLLLGGAGAAHLQLGAHAGAHFGHAQRLADVVGGADVEAGDDVVGIRLRAHEDDRDVLGAGVLLEVAARLEAVHARHDDVKQDQVGLHALRDRQRALAGRGDKSLVSLPAHHRPQHAKAGRGVVDDQDRRSAYWRGGGDGEVHASKSYPLVIFSGNNCCL